MNELKVVVDRREDGQENEQDDCVRCRAETGKLSFVSPLTGIFNRKSSWLKRKPRSVLEDGLGVVLNKPVGRRTKTKCRLPGNEV